MKPKIAGYGSDWICFLLRKRYYEYQLPHPDYVKAIRNIYRYSPFMALNQAKKHGELVKIDHEPEERNQYSAPMVYRIINILEPPPGVIPLRMAYNLWSDGKRFGYHWNKFFIFQTFKGNTCCQKVR